MPRTSSITTSSTSFRHRPHHHNKSGDASIRRGAALIRDEISRSFQLDKNNEPLLHHNTTPITTMEPSVSSSSSTSTDFSDVWLNSNPYSGNNNNKINSHKKKQQQQRTNNKKNQKATSIFRTPPRLRQPRLRQHEESLEYSLESTTTTTPEDVRTFASKGDASQWAKGSVLPLDDTWSCSPEEESSSSSSPQHNRWRKTTTTEHAGFDFIGPDYAEEFELDDYDEVCHPLYSRRTTPPVSKPRHAVTPQKSRHKPRHNDSSLSSSTTKISIVGKIPNPHVVADLVDEEPPTPAQLFEERRQGPPSPSTSGESTFSSQRPSHQQQKQRPKSLSDQVPSPLQVDYDLLLQDPAYLHAQRAGHLWQSLVGQMIRFPSRWWNGARAPPLGLDDQATAVWHYWGRFASNDVRLRRFVKNRAAPGRLLLHICMLDLVTCQPLQDIVVGCFHPGARGIRTTDSADNQWDGVRDLFLAVRKRVPGAVSVMDECLHLDKDTSSSSSSSSSKQGPLGPRRKVTNANVRAVYGEQPPVETLFLPESYLYELYHQAAKKHHHAVAPPLVLLQEFVFA